MRAGNCCKDECIPEGSVFFTSVGHSFPAVCIRTSTERPEALDKRCFILAGGIDEGGPFAGGGHCGRDEQARAVLVSLCLTMWTRM